MRKPKGAAGRRLAPLPVGRPRKPKATGNHQTRRKPQTVPVVPVVRLFPSRRRPSDSRILKQRDGIPSILRTPWPFRRVSLTSSPAAMPPPAHRWSSKPLAAAGERLVPFICIYQEKRCRRRQKHCSRIIFKHPSSIPSKESLRLKGPKCLNCRWTSASNPSPKPIWLSPKPMRKENLPGVSTAADFATIKMPRDLLDAVSYRAQEKPDLINFQIRFFYSHQKIPARVRAVFEAIQNERATDRCRSRP